jgi:hypothetical protein
MGAFVLDTGAAGVTAVGVEALCILDAYVKTPGKPEREQILDLLSRLYFSRSQQKMIFTSASYFFRPMSGYLAW